MFKKKPLTTRVYRYYRDHQTEVTEVVKPLSRATKPFKRQMLSVLSKLPISLPHRHDTAWKRTIKHWRRRRRIIFAVAAAFILLVLPTIYLTLRNPKETEAAPWATTAGSWTKRKQVTLTNNSGQTFEANTTYAVNINTQALVSAGYLKSDCSDLRVYYQPDLNTTTKLAYYFDTAADATNCSDSTSTKVYFPLQANLSNSSSTGAYYIYYGNTAAASEASVDAFDVGSTQALMVCPFNGDTECINGDGAESPTTKTGAIRYGGSKSALSFDGQTNLSETADYVTPTNMSILNTTEGTVEMWVYPRLVTGRNWGSGNTADHIFAARTGTNANRLYLMQGDDGKFKIGFSDTFMIDTGANLTQDSWNHIVIQWQNSTQVTAYLNGAQVYSATRTALSGVPTSISIGTYIITNTTRYNGYIDEVRISDIARYTSNFTPQTAPFVRDDHTKLLYHFDENGDDPRNTGKAIDDSGNGNHGTITGAKYVAGLVGVDASTSDSGNVPSQSYADHSGVFIEEGTTNLVTNPSFENGTAYDTNWNFTQAAPSSITVDTSTGSSATAVSMQRKTWYDGARYWVGFYSQADSRAEFWYSTDGSSWTENTSARISSSGIGMDLEADGSNAYVAYTNSSGNTIVRKAASYPSTSFSWGSENIVLSATCVAGLHYSKLAKDSASKIWLLADLWDGGICPGSFLAGTQIKMWDGKNLAIESVNMGDEILGYNETTGQYTKNTVTNLITHEVEEYLTLRSASSVVRVTPNHQFFVGSGHYVQASDLVVGDAVFVLNNESAHWEVITSIQHTASTTRVYDIGTDGAHNFFADHYLVHNIGTLKLRAVQSSNADDPSTWNSSTILKSPIDNLNYAYDIVSLGSGSVYAIWQSNTTIEGKKFNGTSWDTSATSIATGTALQGNTISAASDSSGNIHLVYINSSGQVMYQEYTTSWQTAVTLDSNTGNAYPTISIDTSSSSLHVSWIRSNSVYYKKGISPYSSGYWDASATTIVATGTNIYLTSGETTFGTSFPFLSWTEGTGSPYNVKFETLSFGSLTVTENTASPYYKFGSKSAKIVASGTGANNFTTTIDPNSTANHTLSAYVYNGTSGAVGGTVDNTVAQLVWEGTAQSGTTYTDLGGGWWRLSYTTTTTDASNEYGIYVLDTKTVYLDGVQLEALKYATSYTDGSLGSGYSWSGTANASTSSRTTEDLRYTTTSNISASAGTVSFWIKPNWNGGDNFGSGYQRRSFLASMDYYGGTGFRFTADSDSSGNSYNSIYFASASSGSRVVNTTITSGKWYHVVGTWGSGQATLYVNNTSSGAGSFSMALQASLYVGRWGQAINGNNVISDLRVLDTELTSTQVADLYYSGLGSHQVQSDYTERFSGTEAPVLTWHLDEGYGTTAHDTTIKGNDGTISGAVWASDTYASPKQGKSLQFDGSNDYVYRTYSNDDELDPGSLPFSVSTWFKSPSSTGAQRNLISRYNSSGYKLYMNTSGNICFAVDDDSTWSPDDSTCTAASLADSKWHLVTAVRDTSTISVFIDGVQAASTATTVTGHLSGSAPTLYVGIDSDGTSNPWSGFIDEVRVYNHALTTAEILAEVSARGSVKGVSTAYATQGTEGSLGQGLVGYWKMDEPSWNGTAGEVVDSSSNGNHGTRADNATTTTGKFGNGGTFDGTGDYVSIGDKDILDGVTQLTYSAWVNPTNLSQYQVIGGKWDNGSQQTFLFLQWITTGVLRFYTPVSLTDSNTYGTTSSGLTAGTWSHVTAVYNGSGASNTERLQIYINGVQQPLTFNGTVPSSLPTSGTGSLLLGRGGGLTSWDYYGVQDEARVYNRALSPAEVQALYNYAPGPVAYWKMDDGSGTSVVDSSGNGHTGTATAQTTIVTGKFGKARNSSSSAGQITYTAINTPTEYTAMAWAQFPLPTTTDGWRTLFSHNGGTYHPVLVDVNGFLGIYNNAWSSSGFDVDSLSAGWHHIASTASGSTTLFYIDGKYVGTAAGKISTSDFSSLGNYTASGGQWFGTFDEAKIYDYVRTPQQIVEDMNAGHPAPGSPVGSPKLYLKFDEGYGDTANNAGTLGSSSNGDLGGATCSTPGSGSCPVWTNDGKQGKAITYDATDDYVSVNLPGIIDSGTGSFTTGAWVKRVGASHGSAVIAAKTGYHGGILTSTSTISCGIANTTPTNFNTTAYTNAAGEWHYIACVYDESAGKLKQYIDGAYFSEVAVSGTIYNYTDTFFIGGNSVPHYSNSTVDEVKVYDSALTDSQIAAEYNMGKAAVLGALSTTATGVSSNSSDRSYCPPGDTTGTCGPVAEYKFDEKVVGDAQTIIDTSGNGYTATTNDGANNTGMSCATPGKYGASCTFDAVDDLITSTNVAYKSNSTGTVTAWFKNLTSTGSDVIFWLGDKDVTNTYFSIELRTSNVIRISNRLSGTWEFIKETGTNAYSLGVWNHLAIVQNGTAPKMYLNGKEMTLSDVSAPSSAGAWFSALAAIDRMSIGAAGFNTPNAYFDGPIDQVKVFNYAFTPEQVAWDYNQGKPLAYYKFDECTGATLHSSNETYDSNLNATWTGSGGSQTSVGDCSTGGTAWGNGATGKSNGSLNFDGTDDKVQVVQPVTQARFSYSFWMKPSSLPGSTAYIVSEGPSYTNTNYIALYSDGDLDFRIFSSQIATTNTPISASNWYHIVGTYDGTNGKLYINGQLVKTAAATKGGTPDRFSIGGGADGTNFFTGQLDEVKVYSYALSQQQILTDYNAGAVNYAN